MPAPALAQAALPEGGGHLAAGSIVIGVMLVFLGGAWALLRHLARELGAGGAASRMAELPLGVPEGSVRALLSIFIIVFGFLLLALAGPLGLRAGEALTGFIGAVISFYFATRAGEQSARGAEAARVAEALAATLRLPASMPAEPTGPATVTEAVRGAVSTITAAAAESPPIARGLAALGLGGALGGPAGLVGAVLLGGLGLVGERERFARWKAAMLEAPLEPGLLPRTVDAGLAATALMRSPALAFALAPAGTLEPALALATWEAVGWRAGEAPRPAPEVAAHILAGNGPEQLRTIFRANPEALAEAVEEFRAAMTGAAALAGLGMDAVAVGEVAVPVPALADALRVVRQDGRIAAEIERLVALTEMLGRADAAALTRAVAAIPALLRRA